MLPLTGAGLSELGMHKQSDFRKCNVIDHIKSTLTEPKPASQPASQPASPTATQSVSQSASQPISHRGHTARPHPQHLYPIRVNWMFYT